MALLHVNFFSDVLGMSMNMDVILPQETKGQIGMKGRTREGKIPSLYLLHGMSDDHTIWQRRTSIERYVSQMGIAVIMPCVHLSFYTNMVHGLPYWDYISEELPSLCQNFFPQLSARPEDNFAAGLSIGGRTTSSQASRWAATARGMSPSPNRSSTPRRPACPAPWIWQRSTGRKGIRPRSAFGQIFSEAPRSWKARTMIFWLLLPGAAGRAGRFRLFMHGAARKIFFMPITAVPGMWSGDLALI